jgi:hypothetical protein
MISVSYASSRLTPHQVGDHLELLGVNVAIAVQVEHLDDTKKNESKQKKITFIK